MCRSCTKLCGGDCKSLPSAIAKEVGYGGVGENRIRFFQSNPKKGKGLKKKLVYTRKNPNRKCANTQKVGDLVMSVFARGNPRFLISR